jgi:hypothetical protein
MWKKPGVQVVDKKNDASPITGESFRVAGFFATNLQETAECRASAC